MRDRTDTPTVTGSMNLRRRGNNYGQRVRDIEQILLTPLVMSATGGMANHAIPVFYERLASSLANKSDESYSRTLVQEPNHLLHFYAQPFNASEDPAPAVDSQPSPIKPPFNGHGHATLRTKLLQMNYMFCFSCSSSICKLAFSLLTENFNLPFPLHHLLCR